MQRIVLTITFCLISASNGIHSTETATGCNYHSNESHRTRHSHVIFESITIANNSLEIDFDIQLNNYCDDHSCTILHIPDVILLSINSKYNILEISINNMNVYTIPNADVLLPIDNEIHHIYLSNALLSNNSLYNQNIIKIDETFERYYPGAISVSSQQRYTLHVDSSTLNASLSNICINSPIKTVESANMSAGELRCGSILYEWSEEVDYYYFELTHTSDVIFDFCGSSYDTYIQCHSLDFETKLSHVWLDNCFPGQLLMPSLPKGRYIVETGVDGDIKGQGHNYRDYLLEISCDPVYIDSNENNDTMDNETVYSYYELYEPSSQNIEWFEAEKKCEQYGTTLATIITDNDLEEAIKVINDSLPLSLKFNVSVWIGLYGTSDNWQWVDGSLCNYTTSGNCIDDIHWHINQPDGNPVSDLSDLQKFGATLSVTELREHENENNVQAFYDLQFDAEPSGVVFFLCNGPDSKYNVQKCSGNNCWHYEHTFTDYVIEADIEEVFEQFIGHWNSTLFIVGNSHIHHTNMQPFADNYLWNHKGYNANTSWTNAQLYSQHENVLYIYGTEFNAKFIYNQATLLQIDLNTWQTTQHNGDFVETFPLITKCIVAGTNSVYFVQQTRVLKYSTDSRRLATGPLFETDLPAITDETATTSCVITNDEKFIYVFAMAYVSMWSNHLQFITVKYDLVKEQMVHFKKSDECLAKYGFVTAVMAPNNNIYLHGCHESAWKTLIYDTTKDHFKNATTDVDVPENANMPYYRSSKLVAVDDNIMYMFTLNENDISVHSTITDQVSINFGETDTTAKVWPSDGFDLRYFINDFSNLTNNYQFRFHCNYTKNNSNKLLELNTLNDHCICNESSYKCDGCHQHVNTEDYLNDNNIDQLTFIPIYDNNNSYNFSEPLIIPNAITIAFQRCVASITKPWVFKNNVSHSIISSFNFSENCYDRIGTSYSLNITAPSIDLLKELIVEIMPNNKTTCNVCRYASDRTNENSCIQCNDNKFTIIEDFNSLNDVEFKTKFFSNMQDLKVIFVDDTIQHANDNYKHEVFNHYWLLLILVIPAGFIFYWWLIYMNAVIVKKALVLIIPIGSFDNQLMFLPGVRANVIDLTNLWRDEYGYDVFICNKMTLYSTKQDVINFIDEHIQTLQQPYYKAVIVHVITHGSKCAFMTSDLEELKLDFIKHELIEAQGADNPSLIKLIFNHGCRGEADYSIQRLKSLSPEIAKREPFDEQYQYELRAMPALNPQINNRKSEDISHDSNLEVISGNVDGRTMSDSGKFTNCICKSFGKNVGKYVKADYDTLIVEIGRNLEKVTKSAELVNRNGTLRHNQIRFVKYKENGCSGSNRLEHNYKKSDSLDEFKEPLLVTIL